jgi:hypothetical protein
MVTCYGLDGLGIESRWGRDFSHTSRPALGPTQPPVQCVPGLSRGQSGRGVMLTTPYSKRRVHERIELYLYSPSGPVEACNGTAYFIIVVKNGKMTGYMYTPVCVCVRARAGRMCLVSCIHYCMFGYSVASQPLH